MDALNHTHELGARSWIESANGHPDFPMQNLPVSVFRRAASSEPWRGGIAIGNEVLDLAAVIEFARPTCDAGHAAELASRGRLNDLMAAGYGAWRTLRHAVFDMLASDASPSVRGMVERCLVAQSDIEHRVPADIRDYTDFYTSVHHALNVGRLMRPDNPLTSNFRWLPIAYHGRASSIVPSGTRFHRPMGQARAPGASAPSYGPCARLDYELELGFYIGPGNPLGRPVELANAEQQIFGMCLLNDWSARDHQFWEMDPLGPFLGKNFCTTVSPWIVTMEALSPFRTPMPTRRAEEPQPLPYLDNDDVRTRGGVDIQLSVAIVSRLHRDRGLRPSVVSRTSFRHQYWSVAQMVAQHTVGGCNLQPGDLIGTGTISGPEPAEAGALVELSSAGTRPISLSNTGESRGFLEDGDAVIFRGWCERAGAVQIGFGECRGEVMPPIA